MRLVQLKTHLAVVLTVLLSVLTASSTVCLGQTLSNSKHGDPADRFYQIDEWLPTPNEVRLASGAPGPKYWQQRADYDIDIKLDDENQRLDGISRIKYHNVSPHTLDYVWIQLDQNHYRKDADSVTAGPAPSLGSKQSFSAMKSILIRKTFEGGYKIATVTDGNGAALPYTIVKTMMRVDLPEPLAPHESTGIQIAYSFNIPDAKLIRGRCGFEYFEADDNYLYEMAQWFPRVVSYTDYAGWQHKQFLGRGEFTLELGDYRVRIDAPAAMVVAATGELQNADEVLNPEWRDRLKTVAESKKPVFIVTPDEAKKNEPARTKKRKVWDFKADNVRDFAFAASRKFIWDAMATEIEGKNVLAMSYYPNEAEPLWSQYSTESIVHTLDVYGRYAFPYPYPVAISVNGPIYGMEYPMICFNGPRPEADGTYSKATKYGLISVVIHEVGHNFFPMIVNSDERQWTWMDEGLNTFLQYLAEQEWEDEYPSRRGDPEKIVPYMRGGNQRPIMTGSEEILQFGSNAYAKPATALNILRETILGRELFDFAFRKYAVRWRFKRPTPADFFRTMEDASGVDLDWFWRGWFYSTDHVDIGISGVRLYQIDAGDPDEAAERKRQERDQREPTLSKTRNKDLAKRIDWQPGLKDYYNSSDYDPTRVEESDRKSFQTFLDGLDSEERALLRRKTNFYVVSFDNVGGVVMPIIVRLHFSDNTSEIVTTPAQIWRQDGRRVSKLFVTDKEITRIELDPRRETADAEESNNHYPPKLVPSRFKLFKTAKTKNEMQKAAKKDDSKSDDSEKDDKKSSDAKKGDAKNANESGGKAKPADAKKNDAGDDAKKNEASTPDAAVEGDAAAEGDGDAEAAE